MKIIYFKRVLAVTAVILSSFSSFSQGFSGTFAIPNWTLSNPVGGAVNTAGAPSSISLTGGDLFSAGNTDYTTTYTGGCPISISFDWSVSHPDCTYDNIYYGINGVFTFLTDCSATGAVGPLTLNPGETLTFRVNTEDGVGGFPTLIISNFQHTGGFQGSFAPVNWVTTNNNSNGSVNTTAAPCSITLNGSNNFSGVAGSIDYTATFSSCSTVSFTYNVTHPDCGADDVRYAINGVFTTITSCNASGNVGPLTIPAGGTFTFSISTIDNIFGAPTATFSNFVVTGDLIVPVPNLASLTDITNECSVTLPTAPTATDNCAGSITGTTGAVFPITTPGTTVITWTYNDGNGNTTTQTQNVVIDDVTAPVITCPMDIVMSNDAGVCGAIVSFTTPTAVDNCSGMSNNLILNGSAESAFANWNITQSGGDGWNISGATYVGTSSFIGSYDWCVKNQLVDLLANGYTAAQLDAVPSIEVNEWYKANACCSTNDQYFFSADLLDASMNVITNYSLGSQGSPQLSTASWTEVSNVFTAYGTGVRYVRITHGSKDMEGWAGQYGTEIDATSVRVNVIPSIAQTDATGLMSGDEFPVGMTTIEYTATDANGNSSTCSFTVTVNDVEVPMADLATLADIMSECEVTSLTDPTATDNCSSTVMVTNDAVLPITSDVTVTWTYDDGNGNTTTQTQNVVIQAINATVSVSTVTITANNSNVGVTYQWVDCDNSDAPIAGEIGMSFTATVTGNYAVEVTEGNCTEMSACNLIDFTSISEISTELLNVYPNPATSVMNIETSKEGAVNFYDVSGKLIYTQNVVSGKNELNVTELATGAYTLRLTTASGTQTVRFVISRQ